MNTTTLSPPLSSHLRRERSQASERSLPLPMLRRVQVDGSARMLLIQSRWMGDVLLCTPAVRALRRAYPGAHLTFASEPAGADALQGNPHLDEVIVLRAGWRAAMRTHRTLRERRFDVVVDFRSTTSTARLTALSGAAVRIGWRGRGPRNIAYTHLLHRSRGEEYVARQKVRLLSPLGIDPQTADPALEIAPGYADRAPAARLWERQGLAGQHVVAISPVSRTRHKQWGAERWAAVADAIAATGARVLLVSGPAEGGQLSAVVERMHGPAVCDWSARSVRELAAIYERCALWVGNDGGLRHVAVAAGTPTVTIFRWQQTANWSDTHPASGQIGLEAAPPRGCDLRCDDCAHLGCLEAVTVERVVNAARTQLARAAGSERGAGAFHSLG